MKELLTEVWMTLSDVCEFSDDPEYHLDIDSMRNLLQRVDAQIKLL